MVRNLVTLWQSLCDNQKINRGLDSKKLNGCKKNSQTCVVRGQKWPPLEMNGKYAKIQIIFCVYNLQIIHDAEKECTAIKGWHSKISGVQNRHTLPTPPQTHIYELVWLTVTQSIFLQMHEIQSIIRPKHRHQGSGYTLKHQEYKTDTHTHNTLLYTHKWTGVAVTIWQNWARRLN